MNIKQAETATGISKQNIRFYETQGLLCPARGKDNDYRDYGAQDIRTLKRIKLLRKLGVPVPEVRQILTGEVALADALTAQREALKQQRAELDAVLRVCGELEGESLETLDEDACLARIEHEEQEGNFFMKIVDDFKAVASEEAKHFSFTPNTMIGNAREFTTELLQYAKEHDLDITITKESIYPEFTLDGVEYTACRLFGRYGAVVNCTPAGIDVAREADPPRRKGVRWIYRLLPLLVIFALAFWRFDVSDGLGVRLLLSVSVTACAAGTGFLYYRNRA